MQNAKLAEISLSSVDKTNDLYLAGRGDLRSPEVISVTAAPYLNVSS